MCKEIKRNSIQPIENNKGLCHNCLKQVGEENIRTLNTFCRGYGSSYDNEGIEIQLCKDCYKEEYEEWFDEKPIIDDDGVYENYKFEDNIVELVKSFDIRAKEIIDNQQSCWGFNKERSQAWINVKLGVGNKDDYLKLDYEIYQIPNSLLSTRDKMEFISKENRLDDGIVGLCILNMITKCNLESKNCQMDNGNILKPKIKKSFRETLMDLSILLEVARNNDKDMRDTYNERVDKFFKNIR